MAMAKIIIEMQSGIVRSVSVNDKLLAPHLRGRAFHILNYDAQRGGIEIKQGDGSSHKKAHLKVGTIGESEVKYRVPRA